jgi:hypothetical protein
MVPGKKQNRRYKQINFIGLQNNHHLSQHTVGNVHKLSAKASLGIDRRTAVTHSWIAATSAKHAPFMMLFRQGNRKKSTHCTPLIWRPQAPDQGSTVDFFLFPRLKSIMKGTRFADMEVIQECVTVVL